MKVYLVHRKTWPSEDYSWVTRDKIIAAYLDAAKAHEAADLLSTLPRGQTPGPGEVKGWVEDMEVTE